MKYGLPERTLSTLDSIYHKYPEIKEAIIYGSRAKGKYRSGFDIDISYKTDDTFARADLLHLAGDFDDSDIPYYVDVSIYDKLTNSGSYRGILGK